MQILRHVNNSKAVDDMAHRLRPYFGHGAPPEKKDPKAPVAILIGGTMALEWFAPIYYWVLTRLFHDAFLIPIQGMGLLSVDTATALVTTQIEKLRTSGVVGVNQKVVLIGHSQGGLIAAKIASRDPLVSRVVAVSAPFKGTPMAELKHPGKIMAYLATRIPGGDLVGSAVSVIPAIHLLKPLLEFNLMPGSSIDDMAPNSDFLTELAELLPELAGRLATVSFVPDQLVPLESSLLPGAANYVCCSREDAERLHRAGIHFHWVPIAHRLLGGHIIGHMTGLALNNHRLADLLAITFSHSLED